MTIKRFFPRAMVFLCACCSMILSLTSPARADSEVSAPVFISPVPGQTAIQGGEIPDSFFFTYDTQDQSISLLEQEYTPTISITPSPTSCNRRYEDQIHLSWPEATDENGDAVGYMIELGEWTGTNYFFRVIGKTYDLSFDYDISKTCVYDGVTIPAISRGQKFAVRLQVYDYLDLSIMTSTITDLFRNSEPSLVSNIQLSSYEVHMGESLTIQNASAFDVDGNIAGYEVAFRDMSGNWFNDGEIVGFVNSPTATSIVIQPGAWSVVGNRWALHIRAFDSYGVRGGWSFARISFVVIQPSVKPAYPDTNMVSNHEDAVSISGVVEPSMVSAEVALNACFVINPNAINPGSRFISPVIRVKNTSSMPVVISILSCRAAGNAPKIVDPDLFRLDQWAKLGSADSKRFISLGMQGVKCGSFWFGDELNQAPKPLGVYSAGEMSDYSLQAYHGLAWKEQENFRYMMIFEIRLVP